MVLFQSLVTCYLITAVLGWTATLYEHKNHNGKSLWISGGWSECVNLSGKKLCQYYIGITGAIRKVCAYASDKASSVNTHGSCIRVYRHYNCQGYKKEIKPGTGCHSNWADCDFDDHIRSVSGCGFSH